MWLAMTHPSWSEARGGWLWCTPHPNLEYAAFGREKSTWAGISLSGH